MEKKLEESRQPRGTAREKEKKASSRDHPRWVMISEQKAEKLSHYVCFGSGRINGRWYRFVGKSPPEKGHKRGCKCGITSTSFATPFSTLGFLKGVSAFIYAKSDSSRLRLPIGQRVLRPRWVFCDGVF